MEELAGIALTEFKIKILKQKMEIDHKYATIELLETIDNLTYDEVCAAISYLNHTNLSSYEIFEKVINR